MKRTFLILIFFLKQTGNTKELNYFKCKIYGRCSIWNGGEVILAQSDFIETGTITYPCGGEGSMVICIAIYNSVQYRKI